MPYTETFKAKMVKKMLGPQAVSASKLADQVGVSQPTLSQWKRDAVDRAGMPPPNDDKKAPAPPLSTRDWPLLEKLRLLLEAHRLRETPEARSALLRKEGVTLEQLEQWHLAAAQALTPQSKRGRDKPSADTKRIRQLEAELQRKEKALAEAAALLVLKKKVQALWGDEDDSTDGRNEK